MVICEVLPCVLRLGGYWLQGETGWGQRSCARVFSAAELKRFLQTFPWTTDPARPSSVAIEVA